MANPDRCICCLCGEELDENGECPECGADCDTTNPAHDLWWEEED